jgi:hypothetical protein
VPRQGLLFEATNGRSRFLVEPGRAVLVGRRPPVSPLNVRLSSPFVSQHHLRVVGRLDGTYVIEDVGSPGGIYIDDKRTDHRSIGPDARVKACPLTEWTTRAFTGDGLDTLMQAGPAPIGEALTMARAVLQQLAPLHETHALHGHLTPHEVLRDDSGRYVVLIRGFTLLDDDDALLGAPRYRAPEARRGRLERESDVFAVGLLVYELLTGRHPYSEVDTAQILRSKTLRATPPWEQPGWPECLRDWLSRLLPLHPAGRTTVADALARLDALDAKLIPSLRQRRDA